MYRIAAVVTVALAVIVAVCSGPSGATGFGQRARLTSSTSTSSARLAFARCMRAQGVQGFPDPDASGHTPKETPQELGVTQAKFARATRSCRHLLPNGGSGPDQAELQRMKAQGLRFARCMRGHGVTLPDPAGTGRIPDPASVGIDQGSAQFQAANTACQKYRPPYIPSNAAYNAYAATHG